MPIYDLVSLFEAPFHLWNDSTGSWEQHTEPYSVVGNHLNDTSDNGWYPNHPSRSRRDIGSSWTAIETSVEQFPGDYIAQAVTKGATEWGYRGPIGVYDSDYGYVIDLNNSDLDIIGASSTELQLLAAGSTAISRVIPTNPASDLPTAVAELLREGLPKALGATLVGRRSVSPSAISGEYLNYQFALAPFVADLRRFQEATESAEKLIREYQEGAGKIYRRRYEYDPFYEAREVQVGTRPTSDGFLSGPCSTSGLKERLKTPYGGWNGTRRDVIETERSQWFSGAFTYHIKVSEDMLSKLIRKESEIRSLYGGLSLNTAWNLLPYSWFADWVSNAGDVIHNISAFARDGLVMPWGYVMEACNFRVYREVVGAHYGSSSHMNGSLTTALPPVVSTTINVKYLRRRKATPYGFGLNPDEFTTRQKSILVALGLSR